MSEDSPTHSQQSTFDAAYCHMFKDNLRAIRTVNEGLTGALGPVTPSVNSVTGSVAVDVILREDAQRQIAVYDWDSMSPETLEWVEGRRDRKLPVPVRAVSGQLVWSEVEGQRRDSPTVLVCSVLVLLIGMVLASFALLGTEYGASVASLIAPIFLFAGFYLSKTESNKNQIPRAIKHDLACNELALPLTSIAADEISKITASPAWNSEEMSTHRSGIDLSAEFDRIRNNETVIECQRARSGARPAGDSPTAHAAQESFDANTDMRNSMRVSLGESVISIREYRRQLDELSQTLMLQNRIIADLGMSRELIATAAQMGGDNVARERFEELTRQAADTEERIQLTISALDGFWKP